MYYLTFHSIIPHIVPDRVRSRPLGAIVRKLSTVGKWERVFPIETDQPGGDVYLTHRHWGMYFKHSQNIQTLTYRLHIYISPRYMHETYSVVKINYVGQPTIKKY